MTSRASDICPERPPGRSGRCRSRTRRRTVARLSMRPSRTSEAALWTRRRRGGPAGGTPGRVGEAGWSKTLVPKIGPCHLDGYGRASRADGRQLDRTGGAGLLQGGPATALPLAAIRAFRYVLLYSGLHNLLTGFFPPSACAALRAPGGVVLTSIEARPALVASSSLRALREWSPDVPPDPIGQQETPPWARPGPAPSTFTESR